MDRTERKFFSAEEKKKILSKTGGVCAHCGKKLTPESMTIEHIFPLYRGGNHDEFNITALCLECNQEKANSVYRVEDYYSHIIPEYRMKYVKKNREFIENFKNKSRQVMKTDVRKYKVLTPKGMEVMYRAIKRKGSKKKAMQLYDSLSTCITLERAYEADAVGILHFLEKIKDTICVETYNLYNSEIKILNAIRFGDAYILRCKENIVGAFLFLNPKNYEIESVQLDNILEVTGLKKGMIMTLGLIDGFAEQAFQEIVAGLMTDIMLDGRVPFLFNIVKPPTSDKTLYIELPYKLEGIDSKLGFLTIEGMRQILRLGLFDQFTIDEIDNDPEKQAEYIDNIIYRHSEDKEEDNE